MPNFNYNNPTNIHGDPLTSPEDRLYEMVRDLWVRHGDSSVTFAALEQRQVPAELLHPYKDEEALREAAIDDLIDKIQNSYETITAEAREYLASSGKTEDLSYQKLERLINRHVWLVFNPKNRTFVQLASCENLLNEMQLKKVTDCLSDSFTSVLARMILACGQVKSEEQAALLAVSAIAAINMFVIQPGLVKTIYKTMTRLEPNYSTAQDALNNMILRSVYSNLAINKVF